MANCSSAFGTVRVKADNKILKELAKYVQDVLGYEQACYYTGVDEWDYEDGLASGFFIGCGRWAFEANCKNTYEWLSHGAERSEELAKTWAELNKHDWTIEYEFTDEEGGCQVLYEMECAVHHKAGEEKADMEVISVENYDYTAENLVMLGVYDDIEEAKEQCGE